jgi:hypothetical protein
MIEKLRSLQWEEFITLHYRTFAGLGVDELMESFLEYLRTMPSYGCTFFPVCGELPPDGFFEYRTQHWLIGVGINGVTVVDTEIFRYVNVLPWKDLSWKSAPDQLKMTTLKNGKSKVLYFITPQSELISNMCKKMKYKWAKETGLLKSKDDEEEEVHQTHTVPVSTKQDIKKIQLLSMSRSQASLGGLSIYADTITKSLDRLKRSQSNDLHDDDKPELEEVHQTNAVPVSTKQDIKKSQLLSISRSKASLGGLSIYADTITKSLDRLKRSQSNDLYENDKSVILTKDDIAGYLEDTVLPPNFQAAEETIIGSNAYNQKKKEKQKQNRVAKFEWNSSRVMVQSQPTDNLNDKTNLQSNSDSPSKQIQKEGESQQKNPANINVSQIVEVKSADLFRDVQQKQVSNQENSHLLIEKKNESNQSNSKSSKTLPRANDIIQPTHLAKTKETTMDSPKYNRPISSFMKSQDAAKLINNFDASEQKQSETSILSIDISKSNMKTPNESAKVIPVTAFSKNVKSDHSSLNQNSNIKTFIRRSKPVTNAAFENPTSVTKGNTTINSENDLIASLNQIAHLINPFKDDTISDDLPSHSRAASSRPISPQMK